MLDNYQIKKKINQSLKSKTWTGRSKEILGYL